MYRFATSAILMFLSSTALWGNLASQFPVCSTGTLAQYQSSFGPSAEGNQCGIGILLYSGFTFSAVGTGGAPLLTASQIELTPTNQGFAFSAVTGSEFAVGARQQAVYTIDFGFFIDPAPVVTGADLELDPPSGQVTVVQNFCIDGSFNGNGVCNGTGTSSLTVQNPNLLRNSVVFRPPSLNNVDIQTIITLGSHNGPGGSFDQTITGSRVVTPEPGGFVLSSCLGGMVVAFGWVRTRRRKTAL